MTRFGTITCIIGGHNQNSQSPGSNSGEKNNNNSKLMNQWIIYLLLTKSNDCGQVLAHPYMDIDAVAIAPPTSGIIVDQKLQVNVVCWRQHWLKPKSPTSSTHSS